MEKLLCGDVLEYMENYEGPRFQAVLSDPPYALISIGKRFGKEGSAPAKFGADGRFTRLSAGFRGQSWDSFESLEHYQEWVKVWANLLIEKMLYPGAVCLFYGGTRTWHRLACGLEEGGLEVYDTLMWLHGQGFPKSHNIGKSIEGWDGYGTSLKPAWEPILLCRIPRTYTYANTALKYGTGALNIDGARISAEPRIINTFDDGAKPWGEGAGHPYTSRMHNAGRWPANLLLDEEAAAELDKQTGALKSGAAGPKSRAWGVGGEAALTKHEAHESSGYCDFGGASRFFYCAKAGTKEKNLGTDIKNRHPTVKPISLNKYLATLILPSGTKRRIFVPFAGVASEMIGAFLAGWDEVVGVEMKPEYVEIGRTRLDYWMLKNDKT